MFLFKKFFNLLDLIFKYFFFLKSYRKDTPEDTFKFYNRMKYFYVFEFKKRKNFFKISNKSEYADILEANGFATLKLSDISNKKEFFESINKFRDKFDDISRSEIYMGNSNVMTYCLEYNQTVKNVADPFVDIATQYFGTLPILSSCRLWYSPNNSDEHSKGQLLHIDSEDFKQINVFIPIEEIQLENGPLHIIPKEESKKLYKTLIDKKIINRRNDLIGDEYIKEFNYKTTPILIKKDQCSLVDTSKCYHFGSRKSLKPRKLLNLQFTTAFAGKTPVFRNYDIEKKFSSKKDKLVYGSYKQMYGEKKGLIYHSL